MTLDETIKHCEKEAEKNEEMCRIEEVMGLGLQNTEMMKYAREHKQLAEWLKELKQFKEQEPCEDVISRAKALEVIKQMDIPKDMSVFEIKSHIGVEIGTLPPVTPARKKGEWIKRNNDYFDWYECSECGYGSDGEMKYNRLCDVRTKFCPDCGSQNLNGRVKNNDIR